MERPMQEGLLMVLEVGLGAREVLVAVEALGGWARAVILRYILCILLGTHL